MTAKPSSPVRPARGGFLRPFGCAWFIREFLLGNAPYGSPRIDPKMGAPQSDLFYHYKQALAQETASDRAIRQEEKESEGEERPFDPDRVQGLMEKHLQHIKYKSSGVRYHSFVIYFSNLRRLGWVTATGHEEPSAFQDHYSAGQPRRFYRLTKAGREASEIAWANPYRTLYPEQKISPRRYV